MALFVLVFLAFYSFTTWLFPKSQLWKIVGNQARSVKFCSGFTLVNWPLRDQIHALKIQGELLLSWLLLPERVGKLSLWENSRFERLLSFLDRARGQSVGNFCPKAQSDFHWNTKIGPIIYWKTCNCFKQTKWHSISKVKWLHEFWNLYFVKYGSNW